MSNVIDFLDALARDPRRADPDAYAAAVATLDPAARDALLARDPAAVARAVGATPIVACMVVAPEREQPDEAPAEDEPTRDDPDAPDAPDAHAA